MLGSWKARILVAKKSESYETLRPKCIAVYGEVQKKKSVNTSKVLCRKI